jgi:serine protease
MASGSKVKGQETVNLSWSGAVGATVDIYRNNAFLVNTANDGAYPDSTGARGHGSFTYQVCNAGTQTCSNQVTVTF